MKHLILSSALFCAGAGIAQTTLNSSDVSPSIGDVFELTEADYVSPGPSGANQTWDFSNLNLSSSFSHVSNDAPDATYPNTTIKSTTLTNGNFISNTSHVELSNTEMNLWAVESAQSDIVYSDPQLGMFFPMTLNASQTDDFEAEVIQGGQTMDRTGDVTITIDGSGTLILPSGTYTNVLRLHVVTNIVDEYQGFTFLSETESYAWYVAGTPSYLLQIIEMTTSAGSLQSTIVLTDDAVSVEEVDPLSDLTISPNPFSNELKLDGLESKIEKVEVYDLTGKIVKTVILDENISETTLDTSELEKGMYMLSLFGKEGEILKSEKITKQ